MKKIILIVLSVITLITISACVVQEQENETVDSSFDKMPEPFFGEQGGNPYLAPFFLPTDNSDGNNSLNDIDFNIIEQFIGLEKFYEWIEGIGSDYLRAPQTSLLDYPNLYTFILNFDIPVDELKEFMDKQQRLGMESNSYFYTNEEINIICSLDEARIAEYFVSDYSIVIGDMIYPPAWVYFNSFGDYEAAGITPEMIEEKLDLYAEFSFTAEAAEAFEAKLSEFMETDVVLDRVSQ